MIQGIQNKANQLRDAALKYRLAADAPDVIPGDAHEATLAAERLADEAGHLDLQAADDRKLIADIETLASELEQSPHKSALRTLALRDLQSASGWLRRELGFQA